jgi:hypothetical protein
MLFGKMQKMAVNCLKTVILKREDCCQDYNLHHLFERRGISPFFNAKFPAFGGDLGVSFEKRIFYREVCRCFLRILREILFLNFA